MKKLFLLAAALIMLGIAPIHAQTAAPAKARTEHTRKDGTPDRRFKENKAETAAPVAPTKKDGTPDMRYKTNRNTTPKAADAPRIR